MLVILTTLNVEQILQTFKKSVVILDLDLRLIQSTLYAVMFIYLKIISNLSIKINTS